MRHPACIALALSGLLLACGFAHAADPIDLTLRDGLTIHPPEPALHQGFLYWSTSDTTISPAKPYFDFGGSPTLQLKPNADRILIQFGSLLTSLGGPYQEIDNPTLTLTLVGQPKLPDPAQIHVYQILESWNEGGRDDSENYWAATWLARYHSRRPNVIAWQGAGLSQPGDARLVAGAQVTFEQTTYKRYTPKPDGQGETAEDVPVTVLKITGLDASLADYLARRYVNHGWLIRWDAPDADPNAALTFHSREATQAERECRPALTLRHTPVARPEYGIDLGVAYITRYPEYFAWLDTGRDGDDGGYERKPFRGQPGNGILKQPAYADTPKNPQPGDTVWYVARVKNHGTETLAGGYSYEWRLNDRVVKTGDMPYPLAPQFESELYLALPFPDRLDDHRDEFLTLHVEPLAASDGAVPAENKHNNERTIFTKGRAAGVVADETAAEFYRANENAYGTRAFEDWIQFQIDYWNEVYMAKSRFRDIFPDGAVTRIRVQRVQFVPNGILAGGVHIPFDVRQPKYDGMWGWDFTDARKDAALLTKRDWFFRQTLRMVEPSLIHEMSHQCFGLIDIYWMNMDPPRSADTGEGGKIRVKDIENPGKYLSGIGYWSADSGLMGGGDTRYAPGYEGTGLYSSHSVGGLNTNAPYRGGFFGDYLYDVPDSVTLEVLTPDGQPAGNAEIKIWQSNYGWEPPKQPIDDLAGTDVYYDGTLDANGEYAMPNQETGEDAPFTTLTGHTLKPNIFGRIHVVAFNGDFMIRVKWEGKYYYTFMTLWELNVAYWEGNTHHYQYKLQLNPDMLPGEHYRVIRHSVVTGD